MSATATDLPVELFDLILSFYDSSSFSNKVGISKRQLGAIVLVCRHWALACQPKMFENIRLHGLKDFNRLWEAMSHPLSRIGGYVKTIEYIVWDDLSATPWIYIACRKLKHFPKLSSSVQFRLVSFDIDAKKLTMAIRSPISRCHRIMCIDTLHLSDVKFARLEDLGRAVGELPCLKKAEFYTIMWDEPKRDGEFPALLPCLKSSQKSPACLHLDMFECTDNSAVLWLACLHGTRRLRTEDLQTLYRIVRSRPYSSHFNTRRERDTIYVDGYNWKLEVTVRATERSQQYIHTLRIRIPVAVSDGIDWTSIGEYIVSLGDLHQVCFHFDDSREMEDFAALFIALDMPHLCCSPKLKLTLETTEGDEKHTVCQTDAMRQEVESWLQKEAEECEWTSEEATALARAFRERDLEAYEPMIQKLRKRGRHGGRWRREDEEDASGDEETQESREQKERNLQTCKRTHDGIDQDTMLSGLRRPRKRPHYPASVWVPGPYHEDGRIPHPRFMQVAIAVPNGSPRQRKSIVIGEPGTEPATVEDVSPA
ncbi:hypothetical protein NM688_g2955 [Phlebia brevispora]|uniref:Uncharacterized protein n=1 Tax=Phlebia brevispora TaxID=194682 RepID=A0ACC1T6V0_9APHY|nr:hypothetical protein NM688_g2955 [Phlebia brevispora]